MNTYLDNLFFKNFNIIYIYVIFSIPYTYLLHEKQTFGKMYYYTVYLNMNFHYKSGILYHKY